MPEVISYHLIDITIAQAVLADRQARTALHRTLYDDGSEGESLHVLYREGEEVLSMLASTWLAERGPLPGGAAGG